jgi:hypothetical protein
MNERRDGVKRHSSIHKGSGRLPENDCGVSSEEGRIFDAVESVDVWMRMFVGEERKDVSKPCSGGI